MLSQQRAGLRQGVPSALGPGEGAGVGGTTVCCAVRTVVMLTLFLFSPRLPLMLPPLLPLSSQASLSHSWIFAVASEFVCLPPCPGRLFLRELGLPGPVPFPLPTAVLFLLGGRSVPGAPSWGTAASLAWAEALIDVTTEQRAAQLQWQQAHAAAGRGLRVLPMSWTAEGCF